MKTAGNSASAITIALGSAFHWTRRQCPFGDWLEQIVDRHHFGFFEKSNKLTKIHNYAQRFDKNSQDNILIDHFF